MIVTFLRHGAVDGPPALYGKTDVACSVPGLKDMHAQTQFLTIPDHVYSSPKQRCRQFAEQFSREQNIDLTIADDLREVSFGDWDGVPFDAMEDSWQAVEAYLQNPRDFSPPGGESLNTLYQRVDKYWKKIVNNTEYNAPLIVCHGAVIRMIIANVLQMDYSAAQWFSNLDIRYASLTQIKVSEYNGRTFSRLLQVGAKT